MQSFDSFWGHAPGSSKHAKAEGTYKAQVQNLSRKYHLHAKRQGEKVHLTFILKASKIRAPFNLTVKILGIPQPVIGRCGCSSLPHMYTRRGSDDQSAEHTCNHSKVSNHHGAPHLDVKIMESDKAGALFMKEKKLEIIKHSQSQETSLILMIVFQGAACQTCHRWRNAWSATACQSSKLRIVPGQGAAARQSLCGPLKQTRMVGPPQHEARTQDHMLPLCKSKDAILLRRPKGETTTQQC